MLDRTRHTNPAIQALLDYRGAAATLNVSVRTVHALADAGAFPRVRIAARTLFDPADLRRFIESRKVTGPANGTGAEGGAA